MASHRETVEPGLEVGPAPGPTSRLDVVEAQLAAALEERAVQAQMIEEELARLSGIYDRLRGDLAQARTERDLAFDEARQEREARARETLQLAEELEAARLAASADADRVVPSGEDFVRDRLALAPEEHLPLEAGQLPDVEGFRVIEEIGRGGMATVFRAERTEDGETVAIKLLHEGSKANRTRTELFLREAAVMLQIDHPALLRALDAGDCRYGRYLVLPLVRGRSLAARVRREGPLGEEEAVRLALDIGGALRYCARIGLTHRDVKPSNIMQDEDGRVRLCDFGLAALSDGDSGRPYGSPGYASPEQLSTPDEVDERADIYALGCSLWHLVVGRRPFPGAPRKSFDEARRNDVPDPRFEGADISRRLAQVIRRMTRCKRTRRYRNWDECLLDLMLVEKGNPPFAAHLADALEPDVNAPGAGGVPPVAPDAPLPGPTPLPRIDPSTTPALPRPEEVPEERGAIERLAAALRVEPAPVATPSSPTGDATSQSRRAGWFVSEALAPLNALVTAPHLLVLSAVLLAVLLLGMLAGNRLGSPPVVPRLREEALTLAAKGRGKDAAIALRAAARLLSEDEAAELHRLADDLEAQ